MSNILGRRALVAWGALAISLLAGCSQGPDMSGIAAERERPVRRYDITQALAANGKVIVAGTQSGVALVSHDQGKSWQRQALGNASLVDIAVCAGQGFLAIDHYHKVWFADAEGGNWRSVPLAQPQTPIAVHCDGQGGWWVAGTNATIAGSRDQGRSWQATELGGDAQITSLQFVDAKRGIALGEFGLTAFTDDGGANWHKGPKMPGEFYPYAAVFRNTGEGWASGIAGQMLATRDGGRTWTKQANAAQASLFRLYLNDGVPYGVGSGGVIARLDGGTWRAVPYTDPLPVFLAGGAALPGQSAVAIGGPGGLLRAVSTATQP